MHGFIAGSFQPFFYDYPTHGTGAAFYPDECLKKAVRHLFLSFFLKRLIKV